MSAWINVEADIIEIDTIKITHADYRALVAKVEEFNAKQREQRIAKLKAEAEALGLVVGPKPITIEEGFAAVEKVLRKTIAGDFGPQGEASNLSPFGEDKED